LGPLERTSLTILLGPLERASLNHQSRGHLRFT
jgi:hypothetical protein